MHDRKPDPYRFERDADGSVRLRIRFSAQEADNIETAANGEPLLAWLHALIHETAAMEAASLEGPHLDQHQRVR